jgi:O-succinylbenzoic acid--CoA ligase
MDFIKQIYFRETSMEIEDKVLQFVTEWFSDTPYIETKTSGSTGNPKIIRLNKSDMVISASKTIQFLNLQSHQNALLCLSPETIAGKMMIVRSIVGNFNLYVTNAQSNPLENITESIDFVAMVPLQVQTSLTKNQEKLKQIHTIIVGGSPTSEKLSQELRDAQISAYQTFGMTETISHVALRKIGINEETDYHSLDNITFSVHDQRLIIHYPEIGIDTLETNDLVHLKSNVSFEWLGRADFVINTGGIKVNPEDLENQLASFITIPFFVTGLPDEKLGQKIVAVLEGENQAITFTKQQLETQMSKHLIPKAFLFLPAFIRTASNKIDRLKTLELIGEDVIKSIL